MMYKCTAPVQDTTLSCIANRRKVYNAYEKEITIAWAAAPAFCAALRSGALAV